MSPHPEVDVGLGTGYERLAIWRLLERWLAGLPVRTACEGPVDGMAGMPGLHLVDRARQGTQVTVFHEDPGALDRVRQIYRLLGVEPALATAIARPGALPDRRFDLVLTFNALPAVGDWVAYLEGLAALASRYLVVCVTNPSSYGVAIRKLMRRAEPHGAPELFQARTAEVGGLAFQKPNRAAVPIEFPTERVHLLHQPAVRLAGSRKPVRAEGDEIGQASGLGLFDVSKGGFLVGRGRPAPEAHANQGFVDLQLVLEKSDLHLIRLEMASETLQPFMRLQVRLVGGLRRTQRFFDQPQDEVRLAA